MNKKIAITVMIVTLLIVSFLGQAAEEENSAVASIFTIHHKSYDEFAIKLEANHTRGYRWILDKNYDKKILEYLGMEFIRAKSGLESADGIEVWSFRALREGETTLSFKYAQPWDKDTLPVKTRTCKIMVESPSPK